MSNPNTINFDDVPFGQLCQYSVSVHKLDRNLGDLEAGRRPEQIVPALIRNTENWARHILGRVFNDPNAGESVNERLQGSPKFQRRLAAVNAAISGKNGPATEDKVDAGEPKDILGRMEIMSQHALTSRWQSCMYVLASSGINVGAVNRGFEEMLSALVIEQIAPARAGNSLGGGDTSQFNRRTEGPSFT